MSTSLQATCVVDRPPSKAECGHQLEQNRRVLSDFVRGFFCSVAFIGVQGSWAVQVWSIPLHGCLFGKKIILMGLGGGLGLLWTAAGYQYRFGLWDHTPCRFITS